MEFVEPKIDTYSLKDIQENIVLAGTLVCVFKF